MKIDREVVEKVAALARLKIPEENMEQMAQELTEILSFMEKLNDVDTTDVEPLIYINEDSNRWRDDESATVLTTEQGMMNAPARSDNYFVVPKILEK